MRKINVKKKEAFTILSKFYRQSILSSLTKLKKGVVEFILEHILSKNAKSASNSCSIYRNQLKKFLPVIITAQTNSFTVIKV